MRTRISALLGAMAVSLVASCSNAPADTGPAVTVTVESTVLPSAASASSTSSAVDVPDMPTPAPASGIEVLSSPPPTPTPTPPTPSSTPDPTPAITQRSTPSVSKTSTRIRTTGSSAGLSQASADPAVAGPDDGPACSVDPQYSDEAPTGLRADVRSAWAAVRKLAATKKVTLCLNDGKRSAAQQVALFDEYVKDYGAANARFYVLPPGKSAHVKGFAVDVQPATAYQWLQATKGAQGWCRIYDNEPWHFEYSTAYRTAGCPARLPKPVG